MTLLWDDDADGALTELMNDKNNDMDYVVFTMENAKKAPKMTILEGHKGKGGREAVEKILSDPSCEDQVMTGAFLATAVDERGSVVSTRRKYIHFTWVGPNVGVMVKGKINSLSGGMREKFPSCVIYLQLMGELDQLDADSLQVELLHCGGAHKPTRYSFQNKVLMTA